MTFRIAVHSIMPDMFPGALAFGLSGQALSKGLWELTVHNIRDVATDRHRTVDDVPFGGGAGMVFRPDIVDRSLTQSADAPGPLIHFSPRGQPFSQSLAKELASGPGLRVLCGRYEGIDQRVLDKWMPYEISLGDFLLSGGELAAMSVLDAIIRLLPGVMGNAASAIEESFEDGLLEYPLYTRPAEWDGRPVPDVLLSGHHANIDAWRLDQRNKVTAKRRPDLWARKTSDDDTEPESN